jgi:drug/metabolite transporter (DMT)-like permease
VLNVVAPVLFVLIWSTGFVVARAIDGVADPNLFLVVRFVASAGLFALLAVVLRAEWPAPGELAEAPRGRSAAAGCLCGRRLLGGVATACRRP